MNAIETEQQSVTQKVSEKLPLSVKLGYGGCEGAYSLMWTTFYVFFLFFLTDVAKIAPATAGAILMIGTIWDAITDPIAGMISDRTKSRWGRRRPYIISFMIPFAVISWLIFTDFGFSMGWKIAYFTAMIMLYYTVSDYVIVTSSALAPEMTKDYDERTSLVTYRSVWSQIGAIIAMAAPLMLVEFFAGKTGNLQLGWSGMAAVFGFITIFPILLSWRVTRGRELYFEEPIKIKPKDIWEAISTNKPFLWVSSIYAAGVVAISVTGSVIVYFMTYIMGYDENQSSLSFLFLMVFATLWIPVFNWVSRKYGKRTAVIVSHSIWAVASLGFIFVTPSMSVLWWVLLFFGSIGSSIVYLLAWAMLPDVTEVDEFKTGQRREGIYYSVATFTQKAAASIALLFLGLILEWVGYVPNQPQTPMAAMGIRLVLALTGTIFALLAVWFAIRMKMTKEKHEALKKAIQLKKEGKEWDEASLEGIL